MTIDPKQHVIDVHTGFAKDKDTGHIVGLEQKPHVSLQGVEWPKWVRPHESHVFIKKMEGFPDHVSTPQFEQCSVNRATGEVTVLVKDEDEEAKAVSALVEPTDEKPEAETPVDVSEHHDAA